jgi:hydrogenase expression/formation protein HypC
MRIDEIEGLEARCSAQGVSRTVSLFMVGDQELKAGDWVLVHVGYAIQTLPEKDAMAVWALFDGAPLGD